jgi:hypothetical protein
MNNIPLKALDRPIAFHRIFAEITDSATTGLFLSQLFYWHPRSSDPDHWIWKTQDEWTSETCLSRSEQERARRTLRDLGILEEVKRGIPAKLFYKLNEQRFSCLITDHIETGRKDFASKDAGSCKQGCRSQQTRMQDSANSSAGLNNQESKIAQTAVQDPASILYTENTSKNTTENTTENTSGRVPLSALDFPDELVDPLIRETMPPRAIAPMANTQFSAMRFEEFWQYSVPYAARSNKGAAKKKFMEITDIEYKAFKECYEKAVHAYQKKNPNELPDEKFKYFKGLAKWIDEEGWLDFIPEHSQAGSVNIEMVIAALPGSFRRDVYVILPDGDWRVDVSLCTRAELSSFSMGAYNPESYRKIYFMEEFLKENPEAIQLKDYGSLSVAG